MGACTAGVCQPIVLHAADGARGSGITVDFTDVYWTSGMGAAGSVFKCPINGACVTPTTVKSALNFPYSIVKAPGFANLLFGALVGNTVYDVNASTNALIASLAGQTQTQGIAVSNSNVYWGTSNFVMRGDFVFNSATQMITGTSQVTALTFDATTGNIFATDQGPPGRVISCSGVNPCGNAPLLLATNQPSPGGITITSNRVYWTDYGTGPSYADGGVFSCATGGGAQTTIATGNAYGAATGITSDASSIYWASINSGGIYAYSISSGSVRTLATGQGTTYAITNDAVAVYWVRADGALVKVAK